MPKKQSDNTPTQNAISLLVYLLENDQFHTLSHLAEKFNISKQSISRMLEREDFAFFGRLIKEKSGKEVIYRIDKSALLKRLLRAGLKSDSHERMIPGRALPGKDLLWEIVAMKLKSGGNGKKVSLAVLENLAAKGMI